MKSVDVLTCFSTEFQNLVNFGLVGDALKKNIWSLNVVNLRAFGSGNHHAIDDKPFGGSDGMVLTAPALDKALQSLGPRPEESTALIYLTPQGQRLTQSKIQNLAHHFNHYVFLCGRYSGVDQRFLNQYRFEELSIGDYVLSGGELAAAVTIDALARNWSGVLGNQKSVTQDSLSTYPHVLLEAPLFTRPRDWLGHGVPEILLSGDHGKIQDWQVFVSYLVTYQKRPDLFAQLCLTIQELAAIKRFATQLSPFDLASLGLTTQTIEQFKQEFS